MMIGKNKIISSFLVFSLLLSPAVLAENGDSTNAEHDSIVELVENLDNSDTSETSWIEQILEYFSDGEENS